MGPRDVPSVYAPPTRVVGRVAIAVCALVGLAAFSPAVNSARAVPGDREPTCVPLPPQNTSPPYMTGTMAVGQTVTGYVGTWSSCGSAIDRYSMSLYRCAASCIELFNVGTTTFNYTIPAGDVGEYYTVLSDAHNAEGWNCCAQSPYYGPIADGGGGGGGGATDVCDGSPGVYIYEHVDYQGACVRLTADSASPWHWRIGNDAVSSIRIFGEYSARFYEHIDYGGLVAGFTTDSPDPWGWEIGNDAVSSVRITTSAPDYDGGTGCTNSATSASADTAAGPIGANCVVTGDPPPPSNLAIGWYSYDDPPYCTHKTDPVSAIFYQNAQLQRVINHLNADTPWGAVDTLGDRQRFLTTHVCGEPDHEHSMGSVFQTRYHIRYRQSEEVDDIMGHYTIGTPHFEDITNNGRCDDGWPVGHAVRETVNGWSGFDMGRRRLYEYMGGRHYTFTRNVGNSAHAVQCDNGTAWSNGVVRYIYIPATSRHAP